MSALHELARALGVEREWQAYDGTVCRVDDHHLLALARILGADVRSPSDAERALAGLRAEREARLVEPVVVAWDGEPVVVEVGADDVTAVLEYEDGRVDEWRVAGHAVALPSLPTGAHRLTVVAGARDARATILAAPSRLPALPGSSRWGVFAPLYALHAGARETTGDLEALERLAEWAGRRGASVVGTLPLLALFVGHGREPLATGPYQPVSRCFWNELFIPLAGVADPSPGEHVDLRALARVRRPHLEAEAERARGDAAFAAFLAARPDVVAYARFRAAAEGEGRSAARYHEYVQWRMESELGRRRDTMDARGQALYLDLPVGTHPDGFDVASRPGLFVREASIGAPPDEFQPEGQDWGLAPIDPRAARSDAHRYLRECLGAHMRHARLLRIDHVMGLHRLWIVPRGAPPTAGAYVRYPADEHWAAVCLEAARHGTQIVGENLGTVPEDTDAALHEHRALGMWVAEFHAPERPHAGTLATIGTHDLPTFATWWHDLEPRHRGRLLDALRAGGQLATTYGEVLDPQDVHEALLAWMGESDAEVVLVTLEDLWLETQAQNEPGSDSHQNFSRRFAFGIRDLDSAAELDPARRALDRLDRARRARREADVVT